jgi:hypothetical protein
MVTFTILSRVFFEGLLMTTALGAGVVTAYHGLKLFWRKAARGYWFGEPVSMMAQPVQLKTESFAKALAASNRGTGATQLTPYQDVWGLRSWVRRRVVLTAYETLAFDALRNDDYRWSTMGLRHGLAQVLGVSRKTMFRWFRAKRVYILPGPVEDLVDRGLESPVFRDRIFSVLGEGGTLAGKSWDEISKELEDLLIEFPEVEEV